ncbi:MAG: DNA primase [Gammaproteobacteria bacterium]
MSGRIPQNFIDDLLARTDIVDLIDSFVPLRQAGRNHQALCPFHDEKTASFTVSREKQLYHCFGCGASGTAITFLMEYKGMEFVQVIEDLADRAGLEVPREGGHPGKSSELTELYELLELVVQFYCRQLREHSQSRRAVDYLQQRGINGEVASKFELGFAPGGWDNLCNALGKSEAARSRLTKAGMILQRDNGGYYDRFRDRIMYPIRDQRGRAIGFGGRVLDDASPKYLNSPETPVFHKGRELYGLYQARQTNRQMQRLYLVEGYMDVLVLVEHGITNVAATLGTAATSDHLDRLFRNTPEIIFCFDGDEAGRKAVWRAMDTALPFLHDGHQAYFMFMPEGEDPDSFVRQHGKEGFENSASYLPLSDYLLRELTGDFNPAITEHKSRLLYKLTPYLKRLPGGSLRQLLLHKISRLTGSSTEEIGRLLTTDRKISSHNRAYRAPRQTERTLMAQIVKLLLRSPKLAFLITDMEDLARINLSGSGFLAALIKLIQETPDITCARIIEHWRGTKFEQRLSDLAPAAHARYEKDEEILHSDEYLESEFTGAMTRLREQLRKRQLIEFSGVSSPEMLTDEQKALLRNLNPDARSVPEN